MYTGHPEGFGWSNCCTWLVCAKSAMGTKPSCDLGIMFLISFAIFRAYAHRWGVISSGNWCVACSIMILDLSCKSRICFSTLQCWWCALNPQYVMVCPCSFTRLMKSLSMNLLLSAWYCSISTPTFLPYCLNANFPFNISFLDAFPVEKHMIVCYSGHCILSPYYIICWLSLPWVAHWILP